MVGSNAKVILVGNLIKGAGLQKNVQKIMKIVYGRA
jgi:hypothetical protein